MKTYEITFTTGAVKRVESDDVFIDSVCVLFKRKNDEDWCFAAREWLSVEQVEPVENKVGVSFFESYSATHN